MHTEQEIQAAKESLPSALKAYLDSDELKTAYAEMQKSLVLNLRQAGAVMEAVTLTLIGLEPETKLAPTLNAELAELAPEKRAEILARIDEKIFKVAREKLRAG